MRYKPWLNGNIVLSIDNHIIYNISYSIDIVFLYNVWGEDASGDCG